MSFASCGTGPNKSPMIANAFRGDIQVGVYENIASLGITLPEVTPPVAAFVPFVRSGKQVFLSGHIARKGGKPWAGKLGQELTTEQGREAARGVAVDLIATLNLAVGDLNKIKRIVKLMVLVNSSPSFTEQHLVANGASEVLISVFEAQGKHARSAFGVAQIPFGSCVEIDLIAEVNQ
jgi:enamine deaminase RidA (YjgF/YER057c/UK114 family)